MTKLILLNLFLLLQSLEWRRVNKVDEILDTFTPSEVFTKYYSMCHIGTDKLGCPRNSKLSI